MAKFENLKDTVLIRDRVYEVLRREILIGNLVPGEALNILEISKQIGVSCAPIREALNLLNKDGLVDLMPYKKARVAVGTDEDYDVAFDLRVLMEPYALVASINDIPLKSIFEMRERLTKMYEHPGTISDFYDCDISFHSMMYSSSKSKLLISTLDAVRTYTVRYYSRRFEIIVKAKQKFYENDAFDESMTIKDETREHMVILDAVEKRDCVLAEKLLREHISSNSFAINR